MIKSFISILIVFFCFGTQNYILGQKKFSVLIKLPSSIVLSKSELSYDNGKERKKVSINAKFENIIKDTFYSKFVCLDIYCQNSNGKEFWEQYFISTKNATIVLKETDTTNFILKSELKNATDLLNDKKKLDEFIKNEKQASDSFNITIKDLTISRDSIRSLEMFYYKKELDKKLEFIRRNNSKYFSLWVFKNDFASRYFLNPDTLLSFFKRYFIADLKKCFDGKQIEKILRGRITTSHYGNAPQFHSRDIEKHNVSIEKFKGKYILLNFWASWCVPCVAEFPQFRKFKDLYGENQLVIISVSRDGDFQKCKTAIEKFQMNWINIWNDPEIEKIYGNKQIIPQVYLIDPIGKIVYSRENEKDYNLQKLNKLLESNLKH